MSRRIGIAAVLVLTPAFEATGAMQHDPLGIVLIDAEEPFDVTGSLYDVVLHDVNQDGIDDIFSLSGLVSGSVHVRLSTPDSYDDRQWLLNYDSGSMALSFGDANGDGWLDLYATRRSSASVAGVYHFDGSSFAFVGNVGFGSELQSWSAADRVLDLDGDSLADLVAIRGGSSPGLGVRFSTLSDPVVAALAPGAASWVRVADLTGDGMADVLYQPVSGDPTFVLLPGTGTTQFGDPVSFVGMNTPPTLIDFDSNGTIDLVGELETSVVFVLNQGGGIFDQPVEIPIPDELSELQPIGDFDASGGLDLAIRGGTPVGWRVWRDPFLLGYDAAELMSIGFVGRGRPTTRDLDGDARQDLVLAGNAVQVFLARPEQSDLRVGSRSIPSVPNARHVLAVDTDHDGDPELFVSGDDVQVIDRLADGTYASTEIALDARGYMSAAGDVNGDGFVDVVMSAIDDGLAVFYGSTTGLNPVPVFVGPAEPISFLQIAVADLDGDGVDDIVCADNEADQVRVFSGRTSGDPELVASLPAGQSTASIVVADVDLDGQPEIVSGSWGFVGLHVFHFDDGTWKAGAPIATTNSAYWLVATDIDADGFVDLVPGERTSSTSSLEILYGGSTGFISSCDTGYIDAPSVLEEFVADVDGNGLPDILMSRTPPNAPTMLEPVVYLQTSPRVFEFGGTLPGNDAAGITACDINRDAIPDIVVVDDVRSSTDAVLIYEGRPETCPPDLADPFGTLNIFDLQAYIGLYNAQDPAADLAAPFGSFNIFDLQAYINQYNNGCP